MSFRGTTHDYGTFGTSSNNHKAVVAANYEACTRPREFYREAIMHHSVFTLTR